VLHKIAIRLVNGKTADRKDPRTGVSSGNMFVADTDNNTVKEIIATGYTAIRTLGSGFSKPSGVAVDAHGNVFVADTSNSEVKVILVPGQ
jgi:DNA-binding beta-propeller fold protein YncE